MGPTKLQAGQPAPGRRIPPPLAANLIRCLLLALSAISISPLSPAQATPSAQLPDAPGARAGAGASSSAQCPAQDAATPGATTILANPAAPSVPSSAIMAVPHCPPKRNWVARFYAGPRRHPLTPRDKGWLAARNVVDPINAIAIVGTSAIVIGANAYTPYGPGMAGFGRNVGVAYAQDMTGEFFGTFAIPSIFHQNPHYHRLPHARFYRRLLNTCAQVVWGYSDSGKGIPNYANIIGFAIDDEIGNLYVPGRQTDLRSSTTRYLSNLALAPTNNLISEFLPDVARRVNFQNAVIQRIVNAVARPDAP